NDERSAATCAVDSISYMVYLLLVYNFGLRTHSLWIRAVMKEAACQPLSGLCTHLSYFHFDCSLHQPPRWLSGV
ncbi:hypothetical protein V3C99_002791, partial [Haemonchus contortus]|uniref:Uncharacterized protein n=1 Tax=Haemonchus contortus TaxID=6289 RepID=A0A912M7J9_HAECO